MSSLSVTYPRPRHRSRLDQASIFLLKAVMVDDWGPDAAGRELLGRLHDDRRLLELLRARVARAMLGRTTGTDLRAAATLERALGLLAEAASITVPAQRTGGADA